MGYEKFSSGGESSGDNSSGDQNEMANYSYDEDSSFEESWTIGRVLMWFFIILLIFFQYPKEML